MKETYPPLDSVEYCRACGDEGEAKYAYSCKSQSNANGQYAILDEWMTRECKTCGFKWREKVLEPGA